MSNTQENIFGVVLKHFSVSVKNLNNNNVFLEYGYQFPTDPLLECLPRDFLEAKTLYLLLPKNVLISRAARLQWLLNRLNTTISVSSTKLVSYCYIKCQETHTFNSFQYFS